MSLFMAQSHYSKNRTSMLLGKICSRPVTFCVCVFFGFFAVRDQQQIVHRFVTFNHKHQSPGEK